MHEINSVTITITQLPNGRASVVAELPTPRPGMRLHSAAHSLAIDALGWIGKQPAADGITYSDPTLQDAWLDRVRQYLTDETSERFLTLHEICAAHPNPINSSSRKAEDALRKLLLSMDWQPTKQMRMGRPMAGYARPSDTDLLACEALVKDLKDPEGFAHSVSPEVRNAARRVLGIKGKEGLAA